MGLNVVEKILTDHLLAGSLVPGQEIAVRIDQTLTQDATGTMAYLQFEAMGIPRIRTELSASYVDHNTLQDGFENADDHRYLQSVARKHGILYSRAGNGICHQVHLERFAVPGKTLLGSDSHTPNTGGAGALAIGAGGLDVAVAMGGGPFFLTCPRVYRVNLRGGLRPWVTAKDLILKLLSILTTKGNVGVVIEYGGPGVETLSVPERATVTNMGAELGVTSSVFPSDERTRQFLRAQRREEVWREIKADPDAAYARVIEIDLGDIEPMLACPHSPDNVRPVREMAGLKVQQALVGSCTNSSYADNLRVARILAGRRVHPDVSFGVAPGSRQVLLMMARDGALADVVASGARLLETTCGFCIGAGQSPPTGGVSLRSTNRNFEGRSGTKDAMVYLASPETVVAAALTGEITDPRDLGIEYPPVDMPDEYLVDDCMILPPAPEGEEVVIVRGPNIGDPPRNAALPDSLVGEVTLKVGDKITTDHIMPAGSRLKYRSNVPKYAQFVFENIDGTFPARCLANKEKGRANIVVGGLSYGQGSSREHAALCPMYLGVKVVVAKSLERIHTANLINFGIVPLTFRNETDYDRITQGDEVVLPDLKARLRAGDPVVLENRSRREVYSLEASVTERQREIVVAGGMLNHVRDSLSG
jgi:aconitate hydratase